MTVRPWIKTYPQDVSWDQSFEAFPLDRLTDRAAEKYPQNSFIDFYGRKFTFKAVADLVDRAAKGFQKLGVKKGVQVGLFLPNCPQFIICYYAILKAGGTVVNYSPLYSVPELKHQAEDSETHMMVTLDLETFLPKLAEVMEVTQITKVIVCSLQEVMPRGKGLLFRLARRRDHAKIPADDRYVRFTAIIANDGAPEPVAIDPAEDIAVLQYTGGTTGRPKGAMLTHANLSINLQQAIAWDTTLTEGDGVILGALPFFHVFAMTIIMNGAAYLGAEIILMPKFELEDVLAAIDKHKIRMMPGVPTMYTAILDHPNIDKYDLSSLESCLSGAAPMPLEVKRRFEEMVPSAVVREGYGLTECSPVVSSNPVHGERKLGSIGMPVPGTDLIITDREDPAKEMPLGEPGEICISGPQVMKGYWRNPEATAAAIVGGKLRTGDVGYMDEDGYTFIIDRDKDLILVGGFNVFPRVVEEAIYEHPSVKEVTVIGIHDDYLGEVPKAFVALKEDQPGIDADTLLGFLRERLGKHELPKQVEFRDELPKTMVGKLSKKELKEEEAAKRAAAGAGA